MAVDAASDLPVKPAKKFIKSTVTVHDRTQIETVFDYYLYRGRALGPHAAGGAPRAKGVVPRPAWPKETLRYQVDAYLFYPRQFGLDANTYPKERFFSDMRPLLRFREPKLSYKAMMGQKPGARSPLVFLKTYVSGLALGEERESRQNAVDEGRLFACAFVGALMRGVDRNRKRFERSRASGAATPEELGRCGERLLKLLDKSQALLAEYRALLAVTEALPEAFATVAGELRLIDEYCYYRLRDAIAYLLLLAADDAGDPGSPGVAVRARVQALLAVQDEHAARQGYLQISASSSDAQRERYLHRRGELKRRIWSVLFLEMRAQPFFAFQRQVGAMLAAGLAAVWYAFVQVLLLFQMMQPRQTRDFWGMSGLLFLSAAALAYIVKDRIKEFGRGYFGAGILHKVPDHSERINYRDRRGREVVVGSIKEWAKYLELSKLPAEVARVRKAFGYDQVCEDESIEHVLHYTKNITLSGKLRILDMYPLRVVHDILRLNIDACLPRLGEPARFLNVVDADGSVKSLAFPKVYYLDLALSYSRKDRAGGPLEQAFDYFRLVLDKNGLLRIERLS